MRQCPDVVLVRVSQDDAENFKMTLLEVGEIGRQHAETERALFGEHYPGVDDDRAPGAFENGKVEPDFAEPAQGHDPDRRGCESVGCHRLTPAPPPTELYKAPRFGESGIGRSKHPLALSEPYPQAVDTHSRERLRRLPCRR